MTATDAAGSTPHEFATPLAAHVPTRQGSVANICIRDTIAESAIGLLSGDPGLGKTHAVDHYFATTGTTVTRVEPSAIGRSPKGVLTRLLTSIRPGVRPHGTAIDLVDELRQLLSDRPRTLVIDEAQRLDATGLNLLRELHDAPNTRFAMILVGGANIHRQLTTDPALLSRIARTATFRPMTGRELRAAVDQLHPLIAATPQELIDELDRRLCKGRWRRWVQVAQFAVDRQAAAGHPDGMNQRLVAGAINAISAAL